MLHQECRHRAAHLRNTTKEPTIMKDSQIWLMTSPASEDITPVGNVSSHSLQHGHRDGTSLDRAYCLRHTTEASRLRGQTEQERSKDILVANL